ncbi:hypothetical protein MBLNU459_g2417t1 [Dothideomycetes sp. NU459]
MDVSRLYTSNSFVFTRVTHIHAFFTRLRKEHARLIRGITIDLREASTNYPSHGAIDTSDAITHEWLHYLSCNHSNRQSGAWCSRLSTLRSDVPELQALTIDLSGWQSLQPSMRKAGWAYLRRLLCSLEGLKSLTLIGNCLDSSYWDFTPLPWAPAVWFDPAYNEKESALVELMDNTVAVEDSQSQFKTLEWSVRNGTTTLTVRTRDGKKPREICESVDPTHIPSSGVIMWSAFLEIKARRAADGVLTKDISAHNASL